MDKVTGYCKEHDWDMDFKTCVFGCNRMVDEDTGICPECHDHSNNVVECKLCGILGDVDHFDGNKVTAHKIPWPKQGDINEEV
jgi:predicted amidophosphoribosyltransferase